MPGAADTAARLDAARREQIPQALARLVVVALFIGLWFMLWLAGLRMPVPFLAVLVIEIAFFLVYLACIPLLPSERSVRVGHYAMLAAEIVFHTTMVYFLGGITWLGPFAYVFGLIFANTFLPLRMGAVYTTGVVLAYAALVLLSATGAIPHYTYLNQGPDRYQDTQFVATTLIGGVGVFFSIYLWVNWVGSQLRRERDSAISNRDQLAAARRGVEEANAELENRVHARTAELEAAVVALRDGENLLRSTLESTADGILVVDADGRVAHLNQRFAQMWRISPEVLATRDDDKLLQFVLDQVDNADMFLAKVQELYQTPAESLDSVQFKDGRVFERYSRPLMRDGQVGGRVWSFRDVSDRKRFEAQLLDLANHDPLTGLFNRRRFNEEVEQQLVAGRRYGMSGALLFLDLDQFKDVNDSRGHRAGDELLVGLANLLRGRLRDSDIVARLGGDEFAVLLPFTEREEAESVANDLLKAIRAETFVVSGSPLTITASIGAACFPEDGSTAGEILSRADLAMYQAKEQGRNRVAVFSWHVDWQAKIESRIGWHRRIREALEHDLFVLHAQPILDLASAKITRYELLLRAVEVDGELVLPGVFLDIAERSGLIQDVDRWVVRKAIRMLGEHRAAGRDITFEVNLSGKAFGDPEMLPMIQRELASAGVEPSRLILEVTETAAIANMDDAQRFVHTLHTLGCRFALDDFGVGFSSFSHLKYLPVDYLKIDGSFIRELSRSSVDQQLVQAIVGVARALGKKTIAEFVNDAETVDLLRAYGVDFAQGFHIGRPAPLPDSRLSDVA
jgi:diguanylate cyclase (GGDEF)-like protein/PAS domain S-box-containing protein